MTQTNSSILRGYFDEVVNQIHLQKYLDLETKYFSEKFIGHVPLYVSMGIMTDASSGVKVIIQSVNPGSPAKGKVMVGDEILRVFDGKRTWRTFDELREGVWSQGAFWHHDLPMGSARKSRTRDYPYAWPNSGLRVPLPSFSTKHP